MPLYAAVKKGHIVLIGVALVGVVAYLASRESDSEQPSAIDSASDAVKNAVSTVWKIVPTKYDELIASSEAAYGIPDGVLWRLLYTESRFRDDIITGKKTSPVGALGIAQFMPATAKEWGINPLDPNSAIPGAARYLAWLIRQTGSLDAGVAAYNWGVGNVKRKGLAAAPAETVAYVQNITGTDISVVA